MHLHIIIDSVAFTESVINRIHSSNQKETTILVTKSYREIIVYNGSEEKILNVNEVARWLSTQNIETLTAHFFSTLAAYLILRLPQVQIIKWVVWGGDYYNLPQIRKDYLGPNQVLPKLGVKDRVGFKIINRAMERVNCVIGNLCDLREIKQNLNLDVEYLQLNHLWDAQRFGILDSQETLDQILVGNSNDRSNHHLSTIKQIENLEKELTLLVPLSGVSNDYTQSLKKTVKKTIPNREVNYLDAFIAKSEYYKLLSKCSHLTYGHYRQQGMATLFAFLRSDRVCYLQSSNPYYNYLVSEGFTVFALDTANQWTGTLTIEQKQKNKELIETLFNTTLINSQWQNALDYGNLLQL